MAISFICDFASAGTEAWSKAGTPTLVSGQGKDGTYGLRCNAAASYLTYRMYTGAVVSALNLRGYSFWIKVNTLPATSSKLAQIKTNGGTTAHILTLNSTGTLTISTATSTNTLPADGSWHCVSVYDDNSANVYVDVDGSNWASSSTIVRVPASVYDQLDIGLIDNAANVVYAGICGQDNDNVSGTSTKISSTPYHIAVLLPTSDNNRGAWTGGVGGTTNLFDAVNNVPPTGTATETDTTQIESASTTGTDTCLLNCTTYTAAGVGASDTVDAVIPFAYHGEDIATGTKTGSIYVNSNPNNSANPQTFTFGDDVAALGTYPSGWRPVWGKSAELPTVTKGTAPVVAIKKTDTGNRVASCCFLVIYVKYSSTGTPVSNALDSSVEALGSTSGAKASSLESLGSLVQALLSAYEAAQASSTSSAVNFNALSSLLLAAALTFEATGYSSNSVGSGHESVGAVTGSLGGLYEALTSVLLSLSTPFAANGAPPTRKQVVHNGSLISTTSLGTTVTSTGQGNLIVVNVAHFGGANVTSVTDSAGNTYVSANVLVSDSNVSTVEMWYCLNAIGGVTSVTVNLAGSSPIDVTVAEYSGVPPDATIVSDKLDNSVASTTISCGTIAPQTLSLAVALAVTNSTIASSASFPFTIADTSKTAWRMNYADSLFLSAGSVSPTFTMSSDRAAAYVVAFGPVTDGRLLVSNALTVVLEALLSLSGSGVSQWDATALVQQQALSAIESTQALLTQVTSLIEWLSATILQAQGPHESTASANGTEGSAWESSGSVLVSALESYESLRSLLQQQLESWESLAVAAGTRSSATETLAGRVAALVSAYEAEGSSIGVSTPASTPFESIAQVVLALTAAMETQATISLAISTAIEVTGIVASLSDASHEALSALSVQRDINTETLFTLSQQIDSAIEVLSAVDAAALANWSVDDNGVVTSFVLSTVAVSLAILAQAADVIAAIQAQTIAAAPVVSLQTFESKPLMTFESLTIEPETSMDSVEVEFVSDVDLIDVLPDDEE